MNVSMLMPPPFSQQHNGYLRNYKVTGRAKVLNSKRTVVAIHKDKHVFAATLHVTKVEQGEVTTFMGVMHKVGAQQTCLPLLLAGTPAMRWRVRGHPGDCVLGLLHSGIGIVLLACCN